MQFPYHTAPHRARSARQPGRGRDRRRPTARVVGGADRRRVFVERGAVIRLTVSIRHRSGSEILLQDSGAMFDIADALRLVTEIRTAIAEHGNAIREGATELVVRVALRSFKADGDPVRKPPAMPAVRAQRGDRF
jgi:hypothetical protein